MRRTISLVWQASLLTGTACAQFVHPGISLRINEVQAANSTTFTDEQGRTPDWIEVFNPNDVPLDLLGTRVAIAGTRHLIDGPLLIAPGGFRILWCDGHPELGPDHLGFTLPRTGGPVTLIATDGTTVVDDVQAPALPTDISYGRIGDGEPWWTCFKHATPGTTNATGERIGAPVAAPVADRVSGVYDGPFTLRLSAPAGSTLRYTLDGTAPTLAHGSTWSGPLEIARNTVVRARAFAPIAVPSAAFTGTYLIGEGSGALALTVAPPDLWNDSTGIYTEGLHANHTRSGIRWERPAQVEWLGRDSAAQAVGVRISGSGSRGLAKRSFKLYARGRYDGADDFVFPDGTHCDEAMLRADAVPGAFLMNLLVETVVRNAGMDLEVQASEPLPLYLNGAYWGLYRRMPPKDAEWLRAVSGAEEVDVLEGPTALPLTGNSDHFLAARQALLDAAPLDTLEAMIDLHSLIDLACIDLLTARADQDLNVRCWRPRAGDGRWRWVLFDMDLWAPAFENTVERLCEVSSPETPYVRELLAHPALRERLLARMAILNTTAFAPDRLRAMADSLYHAHLPAMEADHARWSAELGTPPPAAAFARLDAFLAERPALLMEHLAEHTHRRLRTVTLDAPPASQGTLLIEGVALPPGRTEMEWFAGVPMHVEVVPAAGFELAGWKGLDDLGVTLTVDTARSRQVRPLFRAEGLSGRNGL